MVCTSVRPVAYAVTAMVGNEYGRRDFARLDLGILGERVDGIERHTAEDVFSEKGLQTNYTVRLYVQTDTLFLRPPKLFHSAASQYENSCLTITSTLFCTRDTINTRNY